MKHFGLMAAAAALLTMSLSSKWTKKGQKPQSSLQPECMQLLSAPESTLFSMPTIPSSTSSPNPVPAPSCLPADIPENETGAY